MCFSFVAVQTGHLIRGLKLGLEVFLLAYNILFRLFILVFFINNNMRLWNENLWKKQLLYQNLNLFFCLFLKIWALFLFVNKIRISMGLFNFFIFILFWKMFLYKGSSCQIEVWYVSLAVKICNIVWSSEFTHNLHMSYMQAHICQVSSLKCWLGFQTMWHKQSRS